MRSSMEVNCEKTRALADGSRCSIRCSSSRSASILVLLWKSASATRFKMLVLRAPATRAGVCVQKAEILLSAL